MYVDRFRFPCLLLTSLLRCPRKFSHIRPCLQLSLICRPLNRSVLAFAVWLIPPFSSRNFLTQRPRSTKDRSHKFAVIQETIHELQSLESVQHRRPWIIVEHEILLNTDLNKTCENDAELTLICSLAYRFQALNSPLKMGFHEQEQEEDSVCVQSEGNKRLLEIGTLNIKVWRMYEMDAIIDCRASEEWLIESYLLFNYKESFQLIQISCIQFKLP